MFWKWAHPHCFLFQCSFLRSGSEWKNQFSNWFPSSRVHSTDRKRNGERKREKQNKSLLLRAHFPNIMNFTMSFEPRKTYFLVLPDYYRKRNWIQWPEKIKENGHLLGFEPELGPSSSDKFQMSSFYCMQNALVSLWSLCRN